MPPFRRAATHGANGRIRSSSHARPKSTRQPRLADSRAKLGHEPALSDAGLAEHRDEAAPTGPDDLARVAQPTQLGLPADERRVRGREEPVREGGTIREPR